MSVRIPDARDSGMVSIHEAEEGCLRVQGQPERHGQTLLPNLEKRNSKTTNNQHTFIHMHSTNIHSYIYIQPRYIHTHTFKQHIFIHIHPYIYIQPRYIHAQPTTHRPIPNIQSVRIHTTGSLNSQHSTDFKVTGCPCTQ